MAPTTQFFVNDKDINQMVMGYLREKGYLESLSSLQLESNVGEGLMDEELLYLQKLTLQGRWSDTLRYLSPMRRVLLHNFEMLEFMVKKQQYLEALSWLGAGGQKHALMAWKPSKRAMKNNTDLDSSLNMQECSMILDEDDLDMEVLAVLLKEMESHCTKPEFNHLCELMTLENLTDDEKYANWSVSKGRLECFQSMREQLWKVLPGQNSADTASEKSGRDGALLKVCSAALQLQLQGQVADVNQLSRQVQQVSGGGDNTSEVTPPPVVHGVFAGGNLVVEESSYSAQPSKYDLIAATTKPVVVVGKARVPSPSVALSVSEAGSAGAPVVPKPAPAPAAAADVDTESAHVPVISMPSAEEREMQDSPLEMSIAEDTDALFVDSEGRYPNHNNGNNTAHAPVSLPIGGPEVRVEDFGDAGSPVYSPSRGLKDVIRDDAHGIEIHVPRSQPTGLLLSPYRQQQQQQQQYSPSNASVASAGSSRSGIPVPGSRGANANAAAAKGKGVAWTLELNGADDDVDKMVPVNNNNNRSPGRKGALHSDQRAAANARNGRVASRASEKSAAVATAARANAAAKKREGGGSPGRGKAISAASHAAATATTGPPPLPANLVPEAYQETRSAPLLPTQQSGYTRVYSDDASSVGAQTAATMTIDGRTVSTTSSGGGFSRHTDDVSAGGGVTAPMGGWPVEHPPQTMVPPATSHNHNHNQYGGPVPSSSHSHSVHSASPSSQATAPGVAAVGSAHFAAKKHAAWLALLSGGGNSSGAVTFDELTKAACPLRCVKTVGLVADRDDSTKKEIELLVGSNNKSISLLRTAVGGGGGDDEEGGDEYNYGGYGEDAYGNENSHSAASRTYIQREWIEAHRGSVYCLDYHSKSKVFASGSNDKTVRLGKSDSPLLSPPMKGHTGTVRVLSFGRATGGTGKGDTGLHLVASGGAGDFKPRLWDVNTGSNHSVLTAHSACVHGIVWLDPVTLLTGCEGGAIIAHDLRMSGAAWRFDLPAPVCTLATIENAADAGNTYCLAGGTSGVVSLFNARNGHIYATSRVHGDDIRSISVVPAPVVPQKGFSGVSKMKSTTGMPLVFTTSYDGTAAMWKLHTNGFTRLGSASRKPDASAAAGGGVGSTQNNVFERLAVMQGAHDDKVLAGCVVPWTQQAITTGADGRVMRWGVSGK
jgi:WD40 repeat protein